MRNDDLAATVEYILDQHDDLPETRDDLPWTLGSKPHTVRLFTRSGSSNLYLRTWSPDKGRYVKRSTGHGDVERGVCEAAELHVRLSRGERMEDEGGATLGAILDAYHRHAVPDKSDRERRANKRQREFWLSMLGPEADPFEIRPLEWEKVKKARRSGERDARGNRVPEGKRREVGQRSVERDCRYLVAALNWSAGKAELIPHNPLDNRDRFPIPTATPDKVPEDLVLGDAEYRAMLDAAEGRERLALVLAHETGHRIGAIRHLRWSDVDLEAAKVRWRGEHDKMDHEHVQMLSTAAVEAFRRARREHAGVGEAPIFPDPQDPSEPVSRHRMRTWWERMERRAGVEHVEGRGWHSLRRKWASDRQHLSLKAVATEGGWTEPRTLLRRYIAPGEADRRAVAENRPVAAQQPQ